MKTIAKWVVTSFILANTSVCLAISNATPLDAQTVTPVYPEVSSTPPMIQNSRYDQLPVCPATPSNCPDINGHGGDQATCPDYCTVTRSPEVLPYATGTNKVTISAVTPAVCPKAYAALNTYNMQNEAIYQQVPASLSPILGMALFNQYKAAGYSCGVTGTAKNSADYCGLAPTYNSYDFTDNLNGADKGSVVFIMSSTMGGTCSGISRKIKYQYYVVQCTPPAGLYLTGNTSPASVVCGRGKTTWNSLNKTPAEKTPNVNY